MVYCITITIFNIMVYDINNNKFSISALLGLYDVKFPVPHDVVPLHQVRLAEVGPRLHHGGAVRNLREGHHQQLLLFPALPEPPPGRGHDPLRLRHLSEVIRCQLWSITEGVSPSVPRPRSLLHRPFPPLGSAQQLHWEQQRHQSGRSDVRNQQQCKNA